MSLSKSNILNYVVFEEPLELVALYRSSNGMIDSKSK